MTGNDMKKRPDLAVLYECAEIFAGYSEIGLIGQALHLLADGGSARELFAISVMFARWARDCRAAWKKSGEAMRSEKQAASRAATAEYIAICHLRARYLALLACIIRRELRQRVGRKGTGDAGSFVINQPKVFEAIWLKAHDHGSTPAGWNIVAGTNAASAIDTQLRDELVRRGLPPAPPLRHKDSSPIAVHEYPMCGLESLETTLNHLLQLATSKTK